MIPAPYDELQKLLFIGDIGVGKTTLLTRYCDDTWTHAFCLTIGVDFKIKNIVCNEKRVKLQIWDVAPGGERFRTITSSYYRGAHGFLLCFDLTDVTTFRNLKNWLMEIEKYSNNPDVPIIIIGTKKDLADKRQVETEIGREFAESLGFQ